MSEHLKQNLLVLIFKKLILTLIQHWDNVEMWRRTWQRCIYVENRLFDVATKYQRQYNVESMSCAGGVCTFVGFAIVKM